MVRGLFALADLGAAAYQLTENAHGNFRRRYGADRRADRGVDVLERFLRDAAVHERLIDECDLAARADNAEISVRRAEHLLLNGEIAGVAVRHDDDIVLGGERHGAGNVVIVADHGVLCALEERNVGEGRAVIEHDAAEVHRAEHRRESLCDVPAAEDHDAVEERQRLGIVGVRGDRVCCAESSALLLADALAAEQPLLAVKARHAAVERENEPAVLARFNAVAHGARKQAPAEIVGAYILEKHRYVAAALHADVLFAVGAEHKFMHGALAGFQKLHGFAFGLIFHGAAADGAGDAPALADEHCRARAARRAAVVGNDRDEHGVALFFDFI